MLNDAQKRFLRGLERLTRETGVKIDGCGCCGSPWLDDLEDEQIGAEFGYACDEARPTDLCWSDRGIHYRKEGDTDSADSE